MFLLYLYVLVPFGRPLCHLLPLQALSLEIAVSNCCLAESMVNSVAQVLA